MTHYNIQPTIELTMGVYGRDLGHVSDDVAKVLDRVRLDPSNTAQWVTYDPDSKDKTTNSWAARSCSAASICE